MAEQMSGTVGYAGEPSRQEMGDTYTPDDRNKIIQQLSADLVKQEREVQESELSTDENWLDAARILHSMQEGPEAEDLADEDMSKWLLDYTAQAQYNLASGAMAAVEFQDADNMQKLAMRYAMETYEAKDVTWEGVKRLGFALATDPTTYIGLGTFGAGFAGKAAATTGAKKAFMAMLAKPANIAAVEGAGYGALDSAIQQNIEMATGARKEFSPTEAAVAGTIGAVAGKGIVEGVGLAAKGVGKYLDYRASQPAMPMRTGGIPTRAAKSLDELVTDVPEITLGTLEGKRVVPIVADLTKAGGVYRGIDASVTEDVPLMGGPNYPLLQSSQEGGLVWANKGKHVGAKLKKAADEEGFVYGVVTNMMPDSHASNTTAVHAVLETIKAYERDGRLSKTAAKKISVALRNKGRDMGKAKSTDTQRIGKYLKGIPDFNNIDETIKYIDDMPFEARKVLMDTLRSAKVQQIPGIPNINKVLGAIREKEYAGGNWGDAQMVIKIDTKETVKLGEGGYADHPSYTYGLKGEVVGKLGRPVSYQHMFPDFVAARRAAGKDPKGDPRAFDLSAPSQTITPDMVASMSTKPYKHIKSHKQAQMFVDAKRGNWKGSDKSVKEGGVSPTDFAAALVDSDASETLSQYSAKQLTQGVKSGDMKLYQLGDSQAYFATKKNTNYAEEYGFEHPELTGKETSLVSVINNEQNAPKTGALLVAKAIEDGAEVLDAYAVPLKGKPSGLLPAFYEQFGFGELGRIPFDPKYIEDSNKLNDIMHYWKSQGWDPDMGYPDIVIMKWKGKDNERANFTNQLLDGGAAIDRPAGGDLNRLRSGQDSTAAAGQGGRDLQGTAGDSDLRSPERGRGGAVDVQSISSEIDSLSEIELRNMGLIPTEDK